MAATDHPSFVAEDFGLVTQLWASPGSTSGKETTYQSRRHKRCGFDPWVGKIPCKIEWQPTPVFLPGESHGQRSLVGYSPWGHKESDMPEVTTCTHLKCTRFSAFSTLFPIST